MQVVQSFKGSSLDVHIAIMAKRFASHTEEDILEKRRALVPTNTAKANKKAANSLREYLRENNQAADFETYSVLELASLLSHFYLDARKPNGDRYKSTSLEGFRYNLNRYLKSPPYLKKFDIIKDAEFIDANESFSTAIKELKALGYGSIEHFPDIKDEDLCTLYRSVYMDPTTPNGLLNKVQFEIRLYFCRRGSENMEGMTKDTFVVETDENGNKQVRKQNDELLKNRRENDKEGYTGIMPEDPMSPLCPVKSFLLYISRLNPGNNRLWQKPKDSFGEFDSIWYTRKSIGKDTLSGFMTTLSNQCSLSMKYTNHSIRTTGITIISKCGKFVPSQIMAYSGHKSVSSLAVYHRVSNSEKVAMGHVLNDKLRQVNDLPPALPAPPVQAALPAPPVQAGLTAPPVQAALPAPLPLDHSQSSVVPFDSTHDQSLDGVNINDLFSDFNDSTPNQTLTQIQQSRNPTGFVLSGCTIGTLQIIVNK